MVVVGISKLRASCPGAVSITSRRSAALLQATILSPEPLIGPMAVRLATVPLATSTVAIIAFAAVMLKSVHPAGVLCSHDTYRVPPAGTGFEPWAQASAVESLVVRQVTPSVESVSMMGLGTAVEKKVQVM